ncbi:hypothetical protein BD413DRAFT_609320 [Trametes elegans]|nr:hypothetical protein BD413DRAFT_609320 [Trametes elegans]
MAFEQFYYDPALEFERLLDNDRVGPPGDGASLAGATSVAAAAATGMAQVITVEQHALDVDRQRDSVDSEDDDDDDGRERQPLVWRRVAEAMRLDGLD